jgi:hypothetical protein
MMAVVTIQDAAGLRRLLSPFQASPSWANAVGDQRRQARWTRGPAFPDIRLLLLIPSMSLQARLQAASAEYQKLQAELSSVVEARGRLDAQLNENESVKKAGS